MQRYEQTNLPKQPNSIYVCWLDIMGAKAILSRTLVVGATFIARLHKISLNAQSTCGNKVRLYPMIDGLYITCERKEDLESFLKMVFNNLKQIFIETPDIQYKFIVKASIAFGPVIQGFEIRDEEIVKGQYKESLLFGIAMVQAFEGEHEAPPFGVFIDESARAFAPTTTSPYPVKWWTWFTQAQNNETDKLLEQLKAYFDWCKKRSYAIDYPIGRIEHHLEQATQYFGLLKN